MFTHAVNSSYCSEHVMSFFSSLGQASPCISAIAAGRVAASKILESINRQPEIDAYDTKGKKLDDIRGDIEFRDVHFSYPARPGEQIFSGFSLMIHSGMTMALVGESGSGKSTVISLIERFYDPQAGEVLIDGINLKEFQLRWIRGKIGLVSQEPVLFSCSIRDNIAYGKDDATEEEIKIAADLANALKFIEKMPQGLDTRVGDRGIQLSGGQKQRVAIARAILKNPCILLLDEATSALDAESERIVQEALERVMTNRTTILVAHRLCTVRNADLIAVIHGGSIVEKGSHSQLLANPIGAYRQLIRLQEINQDFNQQNLPNQSNILLDVGQQPSQCSSFRRSISRGSSGGNSSRHSFSMFGLPVEIDVQENIIRKPENERSSQEPKKVYIWRLAHLNKPELPVILRLAHLNKPELPVILLGVIAAVVNGVILPIFGMLLSRIIHTFYEPPESLNKDSIFWSEMFIVLGSVSLLAIPARSYCFAVAGSKLIRRVRSMTFSKVLHMDIGWFDEPQNSSGIIGARLSGDAAAVRSLVGDTCALVVENIATLVSGVVIAFTSCWQLALIMLALVPLIGLNGWIQLKFMKGFSTNAKMMFEEATQIADDAVGGIRTVASFSAEDKVIEMYKRKCEDPVKMGIRQGFISGICFGFSFLVVFCAYALSFYSGARLIEDGKTTFTYVFRVFFALNLVAVGISQSSSLLPDATKARSAAASVFAILDQEHKISGANDLGIKLQQVKGCLEFRHVSFCYPTRPDVPIFKDFSLAVESGQTLALVGESGSGKSTAISLLQRFYDPNSGQILLDGIEIQKLQVRWLRQQMGLVNQEPTLFNDTIRANIAYGKEGEVTEAEIIMAAEAANAHKFISGLQQGYETLVGEQGIQLSGGQKQRIAIARAIVKEPKILLLDEATSALDAESEQVVQDALDHVMVNRTTIVVAHRLSTIRAADLIGVVKNGQIIEKGKHEDLINLKDGVHASLLAFRRSAS
uniref:ABC transporter B family member 11 n=1 Tax=Anthurium amnicola TaxID=1678845 RepID=A0A1D1Y062_9ARAE